MHSNSKCTVWTGLLCFIGLLTVFPLLAHVHPARCLKIRWFTPTNEVDLCGHATLASAAALFEVVGNRSDAIRFQSKSGELIAKRQGNLIGLDFPLNAPAEEVPINSDCH